MIKSMTSYGRAVVAFALGRLEVEIQSVNRKHLEINTALPPFFLKYDVEIKKWVAAKIFRGQVNVKVSLIAERGSPVTIYPNKALAREVKSAWDAIAADLGIAIDDATYAKILLQEGGLLVYSEEMQYGAECSHALQQTVHQAIEHCLQMKAVEGNALAADIAARLKKIEGHIEEIAARSLGATDRYRQKLLQRIQEVLDAPTLEDERILREVALFAERVDTAEEITRLKSHLNQAHDIISGHGEVAGKTLEFLIQEMNREANTIGSKCLDVELSRYVIDVKGEIERIREQIQNIE